MAPKRSKKREKLEANNLSPTWPDHPEQLINLISSEPILMATIRGSGVTKLWRSTNGNCKSLSSTSGPHPLPWLEISDHSLESKQISMNSPDSFHPKLKNMGCYARSWLVYSLNTRGDTSLSLGQSHSHRYRYWKGNNKVTKTFSLDWKGITGDLPPFYLCNRPWPSVIPYSWKTLDCDIGDPNCHNPSEPSHFFRIANGIGLQGKFYVLSLQGTLALVEEAGSDCELKITRIRKRRVVPSVKSKYFREFMVESDGKVLVVFLVSRQSIEVVDDVEVYEVDTGDLALVKKRSIGDRSLFLGTNCVMSVLARQVTGCRSNCVYFTIYPDQGWQVYDMKTNNISLIDASDNSI